MVALSGLLVVAAVTTPIALNPPDVYWTQVDVVFLAPDSARNPNSFVATSESLIMTAGIVLQRVNDGAPVPDTSSGDVTMVDQGILEGTMIRLPNAGGQWADNFNRPVLDVQAAGATPSAVREEVTGAIERVNDALLATQTESGVEKKNLIRTQLSPAKAQIQHLTGRISRAVIALIVLGVGMTLAVIVVVDRRRGSLGGGRRHHRVDA